MKFLALNQPCACLVLGLAFLACHSSPGKTSARSIPTHTGKLPDATRYQSMENAEQKSATALPSGRVGLAGPERANDPSL